ncbi:hypothetical protein AX16_009476 [Volvariella volvacea WC 439]|nr:hypothetical protein AX16_009476 [Volvariella volvacea WC 439]
MTRVAWIGHTFTLNVRRKPKPNVQRLEGEEPPAKITKLAIAEEREEDKFEHSYVVKCWSCDSGKGKELPSALEDAKVRSLVDGVMQSMSSARQSEVKAWEEEITACEHTLTLEQLATGPIPASGLAHCSSCDLKENLWLCLTCGGLNCGRQQFGGLPGNGHALAHFESTGHCVSVKLGTITPEGNADIFCYKCQDSKLDPELPVHLAAFGIKVEQQTKTEKSMTELQIEHNLKYDFSLTGDDGKALEPVFGPGLTGLANLGNSCYMASVLQVLFSLPSFQKRYNDGAHDHAITCPEVLPADCVECQIHKVADGLLSGRYSHPATALSSVAAQSDSTITQHASPTPVFQTGIKPTGFKALVGKGHAEFSTMKQQDSEEFLGHLLTVLRRDMHKYKERALDDPTKIFMYALEQRLQCNDCKKVRYRQDETDVLSIAVPAEENGKNEDGKTIYKDVALWDCLESLLGTEALEYSCPSCQKSVIATKQTKFATFPDVLVVHAKKFQLVNWVPAKLDIPVNLPQDDALIFTEQQLGHGLLPDETELPDDGPGGGSAPAQIQFNETALSTLEAMGFSRIRGQKALLATGNTDDAEVAMEWLFAHLEDPDIDDPIDFSKLGGGGGGGGRGQVSEEQVSMLSEMGFTAAQARKALRETNGDAERAVEWLFSHPDDVGEEDVEMGNEASGSASSAPKALPGSKDVPAKYKLKAFISHKGPSVHSGHYVAHIKVGESWVLFNDEKVVKADRESVGELKKLAYLYVFEKA